MATVAANGADVNNGEVPPSPGVINTSKESATPTLDLTPLRLLALRSLLSLLDQIAEPKTLLLDATLAGPLGLVSDVGSLREHGVERMFWLEEPENHLIKTEQDGSDRMIGLEKDVNAPTRAVVYICRPTLSLIRVISGEYTFCTIIIERILLARTRSSHILVRVSQRPCMDTPFASYTLG
jgi:vacuolar protein sorting-associated protein 33A